MLAKNKTYKDSGVIYIPQLGDKPKIMENDGVIIIALHSHILMFDDKSMISTDYITRILDGESFCFDRESEDFCFNNMVDQPSTTRIDDGIDVVFLIKSEVDRYHIIIQPSKSPYYQHKKVMHNYGFISYKSNFSVNGFNAVKTSAMVNKLAGKDVKTVYGENYIFNFIRSDDSKPYRPLNYYINVKADPSAIDSDLSDFQRTSKSSNKYDNNRNGRNHLLRNVSPMGYDAQVA